MDDFIDPFLSSPSWSELNTSSTPSWTGTSASQANGLLAGSLEAYAEDGKNSSTCVIPSTHITENVASEDLDHGSNLLLNGVFDSNSISVSYGQDLNTSCSVTLPHSALTMSSSIESIASEPCKFAQSLGDANSISSVSPMWPSSYTGVSPFIEQGNLQGFGFQGMDNDADALGTTYIENGSYSHMNSSTAASLQDDSGLNSSNLPTLNLEQQVKFINGCLQPLKQEQNGMHNLQFPTFSSGPLMKSAAGLQAHHQLSQSEANSLKLQTTHSTGAQEQATPATTVGCNGTAKPRVRARRGQATDPHSIAERLRREKIAERMKNLQELVPDSNKTDKASMLDEIIDYVKFLQLQVKVLSMSRLGAAGAVVPLITDVQTEGSTRQLLSVGQEEADLSEAEESIALEQEVVKLMESNVTSAMQYLQNKGLCLMPIALASAISSQKGSSSAAIPQDKRKPNDNDQSLNFAERINVENGVHNIHNGGSVIKQEEALKSI